MDTPKHWEIEHNWNGICTVFQSGKALFAIHKYDVHTDGLNGVAQYLNLIVAAPEAVAACELFDHHMQFYGKNIAKSQLQEIYDLVSSALSKAGKKPSA